MSARRPSLDDLIRAQRSAVGLSAAQRATSRARVLATAASAGAALTAGSIAKASVSVISGWQVSGALALVLASGAGAAYFAALRAQGGEVAQVVYSAPVRLGPPVAPSATPTLPPSPAPAISGSAPAGTSRPNVPRSASPVPSSSLASELQLMREVNAALKSGQPARALDLLESPRNSDVGAMREERAAARVFALCQAGNAGAARAEAAVFLRKHPQSPLARRVSASCSPTGKTTVPKIKG